MLLLHIYDVIKSGGRRKWLTKLSHSSHVISPNLTRLTRDLIMTWKPSLHDFHLICIITWLDLKRSGWLEVCYPQSSWAILTICKVWNAWPRVMLHCFVGLKKYHRFDYVKPRKNFNPPRNPDNRTPLGICYMFLLRVVLKWQGSYINTNKTKHIHMIAHRY